MPFIDRFWTGFTYVLSCLSLSPLTGLDGAQQAPLLVSPATSLYKPPRGPVFRPPGGSLDSDLVCDYSQMVGFESCSTAANRSCWLRNPKTGFEYTINTNYEDTNLTPVGIHRTYYLNISDNDNLNADGMVFPYAKIFNNSYPGPWIQGCWGDNITIMVTNNLSNNGTSIHWHGIRQWLTMHMDGVNGITQCPIAPNDYFNYTFRAMQYGSSWYHSHYSVQYADGAVGPLTLHGPTSAPYDEAVPPILMTDWGHNSAFQAVASQLLYKSILLNGTGNITRYNNSVVAPAPIPKPFNIQFDAQNPPKRYLLRLINTSFESTFVFSIDNHYLQVVSADFVPIYPYNTTSVLVGIGQRYNVIVTAMPQSNGQPPPADGNFWIRTWRANCFRFNQDQASEGYEMTGVLRYTDSEATPTSTQWTPVSFDCSDEPYESLKPVLPWKVGPPSNDPVGDVGQNFTVLGKGSPTVYPLAFFSLGGEEYQPLWIDFENPTFLNLNNTGEWNPLWVVIPENYTATDWVYMAIKGTKTGSGTFGAHPLHLHGHDFAILQQIGSTNFPDQLNLTLNNPPRRDVVLLPNDGYVVIAFKTDNPGAWLMHCHIAFHAASGLALQIMERQSAAADIWPSLNTSHALQQAQRGCLNWNSWWGDCNNWWPGDGSACMWGEGAASPDSGI